MNRLGLSLFLIMALAACGEVKSEPDGGGGGPDGGGGSDGGGDQPDAPPANGDVTILVLDQGVPQPGVDVVFQDSNGNLIDQLLTGGDGKVTATISSNAMVTVAQLLNSSYIATTVLGLEAGDEITIGGRAPGYTYDIVGNVTVNWPATPPAGTVRYHIDLGCTSFDTADANTTVPGRVDIYDACLHGTSQVTVVATALDAGYNPLAYAAAPDVPLTGTPLAGTVTLPSWRTDWAQLTLNATNAPSDLAAVIGQFRLFAGGNEFDFPSATGMPPPGATETFTFNFAKGFADATQYGIFTQEGPDPSMPIVSKLWLKQSTSIPTSDSVDMTADLLPGIHDAAVMPVGADVAILWSSDGAQTQADTIFAQAYWDDANGSHTWLILAAPDTASPITIPTLPVSLAAWQPTSTTTFGGAAVLSADFSNTDGYHAFRNFYGPSIFSDQLPPGDYTVRAVISGNGR